MTLVKTLYSAFVRTGILRASINLGNPILAHAAADGVPAGVSVDLAREFAKRLGVEVEFVVFKTASESVQALENGLADIGFFAIDPLRGEQISFTAAYVVIEGAYLVAQTSHIQSLDQVDRPGHRVVVGQGSAYDLYLTRNLKQAQILRAATSQAVVDTFIESGVEVAAGVRQQLQADAARLSGLRLLDGHFMLIRQAMGTPKERGPVAAEYLARFVEDMKATGFVAQALLRHGVKGAQVAPPQAV